MSVLVGCFLALLLCLPLFYTVYFAITRTAIKKVPHVPIFSLDSLLVLLRIARNPGRVHEVTAAMCRRFSPAAAFSMWIPGWRRDLLVLSSPELFEDVLKHQFENFPKGDYQCDNMRDLLGSGIFAVDGIHWRQQRKSTSRLFTARALRESMTTVIHRHLETLIFELGNFADTTARAAVDLQELLNQFTFEVFAEIGFGIEATSGRRASGNNHVTTSLACKFQKAFDSAQRAIALRFVRPVWFWKLQRWLNAGLERQLKRDLATINTVSETMITRLLENHKTSSRVTIGSLFLSSTEDQHNTARQVYRPGLRDAVVNFMLAGRDTSAQTLSWFFYCLSRHPEVEDKIRQELQHTSATLNPHNDENEAEYDQFYLEAAIRETLRLYPPVPFTTKDATIDTVLSDGTIVRAGTTVGLAFYAMGRNRHVWGNDADVFKPERWLDESSGSLKLKNVSAFKFTAFNAGPRTCLGMKLAMLEMKAVAAALLGSFRFEIALGGQISKECEPELGLTMPIRGGLHVHLFRL